MRAAPLLILLLLVPWLGGGSCGAPAGPGPTIRLALNRIEDDLDDLLVVPPGGFSVHVLVESAPVPLDPSSLGVLAQRWGGETLDLSGSFLPTADGAVTLIGNDPGLTEGTWTLQAWVSDRDGRVATATLSFAVRDFGYAPPIGTGQRIWLDFDADLDGTPGADFDVDLESFGLASPLAPALAAQVRDDVVDRTLDRVEEVYRGSDLLGFGFPDPVQVGFDVADPGGPEVTRICIGGSDPTGGSTIGNVLFDPGNANRASVECGSSPPTGIFPRELLVYRNQPSFRSRFDALRTAVGGVPVGEDPLDAVVLDPAFDPSQATPAALARLAVIESAIQSFADALGSVIAHEAGHALGLVAPGAPGGGLHGGALGAEYAHDVGPDGATPPPENLVMKPGGTFNFARLAGVDGETLPVLRFLDFAYLHDRVVLDPRVTALLPPPRLVAVAPATVTATVKVSVSGVDLAATPKLRLRGAGFTYDLIGEQWLDPTTVTGWIVVSQLPPGLYDLEVENPDGQLDRLPAAVTLAP